MPKSALSFEGQTDVSQLGGARYPSYSNLTLTLNCMTDTNTLQALLMAAGMATAGGVIVDELASKVPRSGVRPPDTDQAQKIVKTAFQFWSSGRKR